MPKIKPTETIMMYKRAFFKIVLTAVASFCPAFALAPTAGAAEFAAVSILPQAYFVQRVGGRQVKVMVMVPPGRSPATYDPTPRQMADLGKARAYFRIGVPFERAFLPKLRANYPRMKIVDTAKGVKLRFLDQSDGHEQNTGARHQHGKGSPDPHIWLNPILVKIQAANICRALKKLDPAHSTQYDQGLKSFAADLDALNIRLAGVLRPLKGKILFVFHPAFGYFTDAYGLRQRAIETGGKSPGPRHLAKLIDEAKRQKVKVIFVEPQFDEKTARAMAKAIGGAVVPLDPLAENYLKNMEKIAKSIANSLK